MYNLDVDIYLEIFAANFPVFMPSGKEGRVLRNTPIKSHWYY